MVKRTRHKSDLDKSAAMVALFERYDEVMPPGYSWVAVHCINPEHLDEEESASVNPIVGAYRCHGCGLKGDAYAILQNLENVDFRQAVDLLGSERSSPDSDGKRKVGRFDWL